MSDNIHAPSIGHNQPPPDELTKDHFERNFDHERNSHAIACSRHPVAKLLDRLPAKFLTQLETNEKLQACCRKPREHEIEAFYSTPADRDKGIPDIYVMHCGCGRKHRRLCVGAGDRPVWKVA